MENNNNIIKFLWHLIQYEQGRCSSLYKYVNGDTDIP